MKQTESKPCMSRTSPLRSVVPATAAFSSRVHLASFRSESMVGSPLSPCHLVTLSPCQGNRSRHGQVLDRVDPRLEELAVLAGEADEGVLVEVPVALDQPVHADLLDAADLVA